ncbi:unnamed protein product [Caenorhabditis auriculariae]|uniref:NadR/Ttd14 AAA domain-containing protein n=1 Tax=Caenorhabditis auriculariae TaxID=2777116 RepID=A0A8S1HDD0_9PELO|nr:unnamed protein product [Caenorhabditis auriculariae]
MNPVESDKLTVDLPTEPPLAPVALTNVCHTSELPTSPDADRPKFKVYKIVLTGGPCGGKTTAQVRLATFFREPRMEGVHSAGNGHYPARRPRQRDLLATMHQIENTFFNQASAIKNKNVLIICDRGCMDPSAYSSAEHWNKMLTELKYDEFDLRCNRYDQIAHLVTAADGAEKYYTLANNSIRSEGIDHARDLDKITRNVWVGHPYLDIIDNTNTCTFEDKVNKLIQVVCYRTGIRMGDRLDKNSKKRKWLVSVIDETKFVPYEEFEMEHLYLLTDNPKYQVRLRRRTQRGRSSYTLTAREWFPDEQESIETRKQLSEREYQHYLPMKDNSRAKLFKLRRCFMVGNQYFNLDIYKDPLPPKAEGHQYMFLETYTTAPKGSPIPPLPGFLIVEKEITGDDKYSMYTLSKHANVACPNEFLGAASYKDD